MRKNNEIVSKADILSNLVGNSFPASGGFLQKVPVYGRARVERFFGVLTQRQLKRGVFTSIEELEKKIHEHITMSNKNPKPFGWTKSVEVILEKVSRARSTLDNI